MRHLKGCMIDQFQHLTAAFKPSFASNTERIAVPESEALLP